jgi:glutamyl/glutaminyl-tRNA synthetase
MMNFLAMIGWNPGDEREIFTREQFIDAFEISQVQRSGGKFNEEKLNWFNREHIKKLSEDQKLKYLKEYLPKEILSNEISTDEYLYKVLPIIFERISYFGEIKKLIQEGEYDYFWHRPNPEKGVLSWKGQAPSATKLSLESTLGTISNIDYNEFESIDSIKNTIGALADKNGRGEVLWPLRVALSGKEKSPDPYTLLYILGKDEASLRISKAIDIL